MRKHEYADFKGLVGIQIVICLSAWLLIHAVLLLLLFCFFFKTLTKIFWWVCGGPLGTWGLKLSKPPIPLPLPTKQVEKATKIAATLVWQTSFCSWNQDLNINEPAQKYQHYWVYYIYTLQLNTCTGNAKSKDLNCARDKSIDSRNAFYLLAH